MALIFTSGDMFNFGCFDIYVNTVNCVGIMGKGIALQFKQKFPDYFKDYKKACNEGLYFPGHIYEYKQSSDLSIISFTTKDHWRSPSRYAWIKSGLKELRVYLKEITWKKRVAVPALGCSNGGLSWSQVKPMIEQELGSLEDEITVFNPW